MNLADTIGNFRSISWKVPTYFSRVFKSELEYNLSDMTSRKFPIGLYTLEISDLFYRSILRD